MDSLSTPIKYPGTIHIPHSQSTVSEFTLDSSAVPAERTGTTTKRRATMPTFKGGNFANQDDVTSVENPPTEEPDENRFSAEQYDEEEPGQDDDNNSRAEDDAEEQQVATAEDDDDNTNEEDEEEEEEEDVAGSRKEGSDDDAWEEDQAAESGSESEEDVVVEKVVHAVVEDGVVHASIDPGVLAAGAADDSAAGPAEGLQNTVRRATLSRQGDYAAEKAFVEFRPAPPNVFTKVRGSLWGKVRHVSWAQVHINRRELGDSLQYFKGLQKLVHVYDEAGSNGGSSTVGNYRGPSKKMVVCPLCFDNPHLPLEKSLVACSKDLSSNIGQHFRGHHAGIDIPDYIEIVAPTVVSGGPSAAAGTSSVVSRQSRQSTLERYQAAQARNPALPREAATTAVREAIYRCVNDLGFPNSTVEQPLFREMLLCVKRNAPALQNQDVQISNKAILKLRVQSYNLFVHTVSELVRSIRAHYVLLCGREIPFATICHDIWNGKKKDILGISLMFIDPRNCEPYKIAIGLINIKGHSADHIAVLTESLMQSFGFSTDDLVTSVNDNTQGAILAGKYISGNDEGGKCDMHKADLCLKHATGLVTRSKAKEIVDSNEKFMAIYNKFHAFARWLMSKQARTRYEKLKEWCDQNGQKCIEIPIPGTTRVSGCMILFQACMRMKHVMEEYAAKPRGDAEFKARFPTEHDWDVLCQLEGVILPLQVCSMSIQTNDPSAGSATLLEIFLSRKTIQLMKLPIKDDGGVLILSTNPAHYSDPSTELWDGGFTMKRLEYKRIAVEYTDLCIEAQILVDRLLVEYENYFLQENDPESEKSILANPLIAYLAPLMLINLGVQGAEDQARIHEMFADDMASNFINQAKKQPASEEKEEVVEEDDNSSADEAPLSPTRKRRSGIFAKFQKNLELQKRAQAIAAGTAGNNGDEEAVRVELKKACLTELTAYLSVAESESKDMASMIKKHPSNLYLEHSAKWQKQDRKMFSDHCKEGNYLAVAKYFNVLKWWKANATRFPRVFVSAVVWLGKPATNAEQERMFSMASWYDSNRLMNKQSNKSFEMRTLDSHSRATRDNILLRQMIILQEERERRIAQGEDPDEIEVEDVEAMSDEQAAEQSMQLLALARELEEYNNKADPLLAGPEISRRFARLDPITKEVTYEVMDDLNILDLTTTTTERNPEEDNDDDLVKHLNECIGCAENCVVEVGTNSATIATSTRKVAAPASTRKAPSAKTSTVRVARSAVPVGALPVRAAARPPTPPPKVKGKGKQSTSKPGKGTVAEAPKHPPRTGAKIPRAPAAAAAASRKSAAAAAAASKKSVMMEEKKTKAAAKRAETEAKKEAKKAEAASKKRAAAAKVQAAAKKQKNFHDMLEGRGTATLGLSKPRWTNVVASSTEEDQLDAEDRIGGGRKPADAEGNDDDAVQKPAAKKPTPKKPTPKK